MAPTPLQQRRVKRRVFQVPTAGESYPFQFRAIATLTKLPYISQKAFFLKKRKENAKKKIKKAPKQFRLLQSILQEKIQNYWEKRFWGLFFVKHHDFFFFQ